MPLVLDKYGNKFGKSEGNALWLDKNKTSSYELYQYLINTDDEMVIHYLKVFTFLSKEEIEAIEKEQLAHPETRIAQKTLAREMITDLHGKEEFEKAEEMSQLLFKGNIKGLAVCDLQIGLKDVPHFSITEKMNLVDFLVTNKIASSKREAREWIQAGSITVNGDKITDLEFIVTKEDALEQTLTIVRRGKKKYYVGTWHE